MKRIIFVFLTLIFVLIFLPILDAKELSREKLNGVSLEDVSRGVEVVVKIRESPVRGIMSFNDANPIQEAEPSYKIVRIDPKKLKEMQDDSSVVGIYSSNYIHAFMSQATSIVDSSGANKLQVGPINLTGSNQVVCVIDTGVNFSHPDLIGKNVSCVVDCYNKACVEDCSVGDDNGHGTHVAGIVGASGGIYGIATNVSMIAVKVLGSDGGGGGDSDLNHAIDWCVAQDVSVITMSLGTVSLYASSCDSTSYTPWKTAINAAVAKNISVVAATGNDGNFTHISSPACMSNAIPVGDTYDANIGGVIWGDPEVCREAATYLDKIVCHANRNSLVKLFAPGAMINSTNSSGDYKARGGTSMAAPMVAGAIAIINQYLALSSQTRTPLEIENVLNNTGKRINDSGGSNLNFSRINVYDALLSLDNIAPNVTLISPSDNKINITQNQTFSCNASDWQLANVTLKVWNSSGGLYYNGTNNLTGAANESTFNLIDMPFGVYGWNCLVFDNQGNSAFATANYSLTIGGIYTSMATPSNATHVNTNLTNYTCEVISEGAYELSNVTFYLWNSTGDLIYNKSENISGFDNTTIFNYNFTNEDYYSWNCYGVNNNSNGDWSDDNYTITYDVTNPTLSLVEPLPTSETSNSISKTFNFNVSDTNIHNCSLIINGVASLTNSSINISVDQSFSQPFTPGTYAWMINCSDYAGNINSSSENSFVISGVAVPSSGGSGGGGGGVSAASSVPNISLTYNATTGDLSAGYTKILKKNEKINFSIFDGNGGRHLLSVIEVGSDYVNLTIESDPINFRLGIGQSVKLNLTSVDYYDLMVKLNNISNGSAELTVQLINESIDIRTIEIETEKIIEKEKIVIKTYFWIVIVLIILLIGVVFVVVRRRRAAHDASLPDEDYKRALPSKSKAKKLKGSNPEKKDGAQRVPKYIRKNNGKNNKKIEA